MAIAGDDDRERARDNGLPARFAFDRCLDAPIEPGALRATLCAVIPGRISPEATARSEAPQPG